MTYNYSYFTKTGAKITVGYKTKEDLEEDLFKKGYWFLLNTEKHSWYKRLWWKFTGQKKNPYKWIDFNYEVNWK